MNKYFKNFILYGEIDFHCLICEESFATSEDVEKHIRWENHRKSLKTQTHLPKFKNEGIFKIGNFIYCECCNLVFTNIQFLKLHVSQESHKTNKVTPMKLRQPIVKRDSGIIKISHFPISYQQWHGIFDKKCILCDEKIINLDKHVAQTSHMIKLIGCECNMDDEDKCYRKVNEKLVQCFSCKSHMQLLAFNGHFDTDEHRKNVAAIKAQKANNEAKNAAKPSNSFEIYRKYFDIDDKNTKATCKKCDETLKLDIQMMIQHVGLHEDENIAMYIFDHGKRRSELAKYGKRNFIKMAAKPGKGYCTVCCCSLSAHMNVFTDHVNGVRHLGLLKIKEQQKLGVTEPSSTKLPTKTFKSFIEELHFSTLYKVLYVNKDICTIPVHFLLFTEMDYTEKKIIKCFCCDIEVPSAEMWKHFAKETHKRNFFNTKVVTGLFSEFVREIRPNVFHCVYCNIVIPYWTTMKKHVASFSHRYAKMPCLKLSYDSESILSSKPLQHLENENALYSQLLLYCTLSKMEPNITLLLA